MEKAKTREFLPSPSDFNSDCDEPIYLQNWWQALASKGAMNTITHNQDGQKLGAISFYPRKLYRAFPYGTHFPWTHFCAPIFSPQASACDRVQTAAALVQKLPKNRSLYFTFPHDIGEGVVEVFASAGFSVRAQPSYLLKPEDFSWERDILAQVLARGSMTMRQRFNKAKAGLDLVEIEEGAFFRIYERNLAVRGRRSYGELGLAQALAREAFARGQIRMTAARWKGGPDDETSLVAAVACLEDRHSCYYWMSTRDVTVGDNAVSNGSIRFLLADAIRYAVSRNLTFDLDGAVGEGNSELYRGFRGHEVSRYLVTRITNSERFARALRDHIRTASRCSRGAMTGRKPKAGSITPVETPSPS